MTPKIEVHYVTRKVAETLPFLPAHHPGRVFFGWLIPDHRNLMPPNIFRVKRDKLHETLVCKCVLCRCVSTMLVSRLALAESSQSRVEIAQQFLNTFIVNQGCPHIADIGAYE